MRSWFEQVEFTHVPREENAHANALSKLATGTNFENERHVIVSKEHPSEEPMVGVIGEQGGEGEGWMTPIKAYLLHGAIPEDARQAWQVRRKAARCTILEGQMYKRSHSGAYLRRLTEAEGERAIAEVHQGSCGMHAGARSLEKVLLRQGYYWPTIRKDVKRHVESCHQCQIHSHDVHVPQAPMRGNVGAWPFSQCGMDLLGPFPKAPGQMKYLIVAVDYFSKCVEAEPLATITQAQVKKFTTRNIFSRYRLPESIVADHGKQFDCRQFIKFCDESVVVLRFSSVAYPQANGQAEAANKSILHGLHTIFLDAKGRWVEELPGVLWVHWTTHKVATGETSFALTSGSEAVIPVEVRFPTHRVAEYEESTNGEERVHDLDMLEERRDIASVRLEAMKQQVAKYYNRKMRPHQIRLGSLVLRRDFRPKPCEGKLAPKWKGPYRVREIIGPATFKLERVEGKVIKRTCNAQNLKVYHRTGAEEVYE
ncbi:unnamed protein product [Linum trigynum]|uniref:Integrase catalytic domain-containing protein n=1 Tax=Linum trigynum TaxID=586398 RepID=A0AAV2D7T3_9ROSI